MKHIIYSLYKYYDKGSTKDIAYEKTILVTLLFISMNIFTVLILSDSMYLIDVLKGKSRDMKYFIFIILYFVPGYFILSTIVKKKTFEDADFISRYKSSHGWIIVSYMLLSIVFLFIPISKKM